MSSENRGLDLDARASASEGARALVVGPYLTARATRGDDSTLRAPQARLEAPEGLARALDLESGGAHLVMLSPARPSILIP